MRGFDLRVIRPTAAKPRYRNPSALILGRWGLEGKEGRVHKESRKGIDCQFLDYKYKTVYSSSIFRLQI